MSKRPQSPPASAPAAPPPWMPQAIPYSHRLLIVRAPGGFVLFEADSVGPDQADADPAHAIAVASDPDALIDRLRAWAHATPAAPATS